MRFKGVALDAITSGGPTQVFDATDAQTPIAAIVTVSSAVTSGTPVAGSILGQGITDGTTSLCGGCFSQDSSASSSDAGGRTSTAGVIDISVPTGTGQDAHADFVSFGAGTLTITWANFPATALRMHAVLIFADTTAEAAAVRSHTTTATADTANSITGLTFDPNVAIAITASLGTTYNSLRAVRGFACKVTASTSQQGNSSDFETDAVDPTACAQEWSESFIYSIVAGAAYQVTGWAADGIEITTRRANAASTLFVLLLKTAGRAWVGAPAIGTNATGDKDVNDPGFAVETVFAIGTELTAAADTSTTDATSGHISVGFGTMRGGSASNFCASLLHVDNAAAPNQTTRSVVDTVMVRVINEDLSDDWRGSLTASLPLGFRFNVADASASDRRVVFLALSKPGDQTPNFPTQSGRLWRKQLARM